MRWQPDRSRGQPEATGIDLFLAVAARILIRRGSDPALLFPRGIPMKPRTQPASDKDWAATIALVMLLALALAFALLDPSFRAHIDPSHVIPTR